MRHENRLISLIIRHSGIVIREEEARNRLPAAIRVVIGCVEVTEADIGSSGKTARTAKNATPDAIVVMPSS